MTDLIAVPIANLTPEQRAAAFAALDAIDVQTRKDNESYVSEYRPPMIISDYMPTGALRSMADGKMYDSKSKYYQSVKDAGMVVLGNDAPRTPPKREAYSDLTQKDVKNAIDRLSSR
jgi:hypothetical protein